jgi:hypothetical protein
MSVRSMMEHNKDTTAWGGVSAMLAIMGSDILNAIMIPMAGWLAVYLLKKAVLYLEGIAKNWWNNRKTKITTSNEKE